MYFLILDVRNDPDPEAPLAVVLRGDTTTTGATSTFFGTVRPNLPDEDCSGPAASWLAGDTALRWFSVWEFRSKTIADDCSLRTVDNGRPVHANANFGRCTVPRRD